MKARLQSLAFLNLILTFAQIGLASLITVAQLSGPFVTANAGGQEPTPVQEPVKVEVKTVPEMIRSLSPKYGISASLAEAIAYCESGEKQFTANGELIRGKTTPADVGVFQINEKYHLETSRKLGYDIYSTTGNIEYGLWLMKREGVQHWNASRYCWDK